MMKIKNATMYSMILSAGVLVACGDDEEVEEAGEEVITTLELTFAPQGGGTPVVATFRDLDGDGPDAPTIGPIVLVNGTTYDLTVNALNETVDPSDPDYEIIEEIREEAEEHQFFFTGPAVESEITGPNTEALVTYAYADVESDYVTDATDPDLEVGVAGVVEAIAPGAETGGFVVTLMHQPPQGGQPVKTETSGLTDGEIDIEVEFDLTVQ